MPETPVIRAVEPSVFNSFLRFTMRIAMATSP
jgi:hypothetical protein